MKKELAILMATYNGENYIEEMLDSLLKTQNRISLVVFVRDDGSKDRTESILKRYSIQYPENIVLFFGENMGPIQGFDFLIKKALDEGYEYFMFADQDDIWSEEKVDILYERLKQAGNSNPFLIHHDLAVVNEKLEMMDPSFWHYQNLNPCNVGLNRLLIQNVVTGCTIGINRKLALLASPIPKEAIMHDWWIALVASAFGKIDVIKKPLVFYRQHSTNTIGAQKNKIQINKIKAQLNLSKYTNQANAFYRRYVDIMNEKQSREIISFVNFFTASRLKVIFMIFIFSFYKSGVLRNVGFILKILFQKRV